MSIDQVVSGIVGSTVSLVSNTAVMVAVLLGARPLEVARGADRDGLLQGAARRRSGPAALRGTSPGAGGVVQELAEERFRLDPAGDRSREGAPAPGPGAVLRRRSGHPATRVDQCRATAGPRRRQRQPPLRARGLARRWRTPDRRCRRGRRRPFCRPPRRRPRARGRLPSPPCAQPGALPCQLSPVQRPRDRPRRGRGAHVRRRTVRTDRHDEAAETAPAASRCATRVRARLASTFQYPTRMEPAVRDVSMDGRPWRIESASSDPTGSGKKHPCSTSSSASLTPESGSITRRRDRRLHELPTAWLAAIDRLCPAGRLPRRRHPPRQCRTWLARRRDRRQSGGGGDPSRAARRRRPRPCPDGLETHCRRAGRPRLSGGQRQRVGLARAFYVRPTVLVLDEATSSLDTATERLIVDTLAALQSAPNERSSSRTGFPTVRDCDRIRVPRARASHP